ncbi:hypothetical protein QE109_04625 [Fusibacter bizertensis]|uniref:Uncharacterized protein n=1 Tax=Fusibacter bizertensis TaxID=1488331 RepID=A0ABT6NAH4_9FIRM|nr:hypothetical protein [Fusibacter bizertensis]MDH8677418.1 hypothetical protein [Fusibacter bizertensis]
MEHLTKMKVFKDNESSKVLKVTITNGEKIFVLNEIENITSLL